MPLLSIVIPAYNEAETLEHVVPALRTALCARQIDFEVIFIDDGSTDSTFEKIRRQSEAADNVRGYRFSRNFGKEAAIWAGLKEARGDCCVVMDCDLQHPPESLPEMYRLWESGYEIVEGVKKSGGGSAAYKLFSGIFYRVISRLSGMDMQKSSDFKLLSRRVVNELLRFKERNTFFRGLSFWVGFNSTKIVYEPAARKFGKTKWNFFQLSKYAVNNIVGFSTAPMQLVTGIGIALLAASVVLLIQTLIRFFSGQALEGFPTVILLLLIIGGGVMISLGIIGVYIAKIYDEVKDRPRYIISQSTGGDSDS